MYLTRAFTALPVHVSVKVTAQYANSLHTTSHNLFLSRDAKCNTSFSPDGGLRERSRAGGEKKKKTCDTNGCGVYAGWLNWTLSILFVLNLVFEIAFYFFWQPWQQGSVLLQRHTAGSELLPGQRSQRHYCVCSRLAQRTAQTWCPHSRWGHMKCMAKCADRSHVSEKQTLAARRNPPFIWTVYHWAGHISAMTPAVFGLQVS